MYDHPHAEELSRAFYTALGTTLHREQTIERLAVVLPSQRKVDYGSTWVRLVSDERGCQWHHACRHFHWGRVLTVREYALGRLNEGDTPEEIEDNVETMRLRHARGWRLSEVHCDACGLSELESVPLASVWPCRRVEHGMARRLEFNGQRILDEGWFRQLLHRYQHQTKIEAQAAGLMPGEPLFTVVDEGGK